MQKWSTRAQARTVIDSYAFPNAIACFSRRPRFKGMMYFFLTHWLNINLKIRLDSMTFSLLLTAGLLIHMFPATKRLDYWELLAQWPFSPHLATSIKLWQREIRRPPGVQNTLDERDWSCIYFWIFSHNTTDVDLKESVRISPSKF